MIRRTEKNAENITSKVRTSGATNGKNKNQVDQNTTGLQQLRREDVVHKITNQEKLLERKIIEASDMLKK